MGDCWAQALDASTETTASEATSERGIHEEIFGMIFLEGLGGTRI